MNFKVETDFINKTFSAFILAQLLCFAGLGQETSSDAASVAKKLANPIASLTSVPFQNNLDVGIDSNQGWRNTLNFQPVIPLKLSDGLNLIVRWVQPIIFQQNVLNNHESYESGLGDAVASAFFSPSKVVQGFTWGAGPVFLIPDATNEYLGTKKFGVGPTAVALLQNNGWTFGALVNQIWSVAGSADRPDVNQMFLQPFIGYNWKTGAGMVINTESTFNWENNTTNSFLNFMISGITKFGKQMASLQVGPRLQLAAPHGKKADFGIRAAVILVFPKN
jgi:hypothetical protein